MGSKRGRLIAQVEHQAGRTIAIIRDVSLTTLSGWLKQARAVSGEVVRPFSDPVNARIVQGSTGIFGKLGKPGGIEGHVVPDKSALEDQPMNGLSRINQHGDSSMGTSVSIHELVSGTLAKLGVPAPATVIQTMLMKDGYFVGHKLRYDGGCAIYLAGGSTIEFYDEQGALLTTTALEVETGVAA